MKIKIDDKNVAEPDYGTQEKEVSNGVYPVSKFDHDLFKDEDNIIQPIIRVKFVGVSAKNEKWRILENEKLSLVIEGVKLTKKEKEFLKTIDGVNFLIREYKGGAKSFNQIKKQLKSILSNTTAKGLTKKKR